MRLNRGIRNYIIWSTLTFFSIFFSTAFINPPLNPEANDTSVSGANSIDYAVIDAYARATPESAARDLNTLSNYLTSPAHNDLAKARSVYAWITSHVRYDEALVSTQTYSSEAEYASRILRSRKAVCTGFALLYKHLLNRAGVEVASIKGYSRTNDVDSGLPIQRVDHEWNAVRLDGEWQLVDIAWAQTTAKDGPNGAPQPNDFFFLTDPIAFAANHFPTDPRWQLINPAISKAQFDRFPKVYDAYFRLGFSDDFPKTGLIRTGDMVTLTLENDQDVEFVCSIGRQGGATSTQITPTVRRSGETYQLTVPVAQRGNSTLYVFAKPKSSRRERVKSYEGIASFTVVKS